MKQVTVALFLMLGPLFSHAHGLSEQVTIEVNESGFSPSEVTILPHTIVIFKNVGNESHWPASDVHPTHTNYNNTDLDTHCDASYLGTPFDSCTGIAPGESWEFTFERPGSFHYHDHSWSHLTGVVNVVEETSVASTSSWWQKLINFIINLFSKLSSNLPLSSTDTDQYTNARSELTELVKTDNPRNAINQLQAMAAESEVIAALCHDLLHEIGRTAMQTYGDFSTAISYQTDYCNSGYIHGLFEELFATTEVTADSIQQLCSEYADNGRPFDRWQCFHGAGHGFMYLHGGDLRETITDCQQLPEPAAGHCVNGAFMELFNNEVLANEMQYISPENPYQVCDEAEYGQGDCYHYAPTYYTQLEKLSHSEALDSCQTVPSANRNTCIGGATSEAAKRNMSNLESVYQLCDQFTGQEELACVYGIANITVFQTGSLTEALELCIHAPLPLRDTCRQAVNTSAYLFE